MWYGEKNLGTSRHKKLYSPKQPQARSAPIFEQQAQAQSRQRKPRRRTFSKVQRRDLGEMLTEAKALEGEPRYKLLTRIQRMHGGLGALMALQFGRHLKPFEICGYMWAALLTLPERWVPGTRAPTTEWKHATREKVQDELKRAGSWVAGVRVPMNGREKYTRVTAGPLQLELLLNEHNDGLYFVEDANGAKDHIYRAIAPTELT